MNRDDFFSMLRSEQSAYAPSAHIANFLNSKTVVMLVGPAAIGKSTIMNKAVELDPRLHRVPSFTTRPRRINDEPGMYHYIASDEEFEKLAHDIMNKKVVQYGVSPVKDVVYGTYIKDYLREYNLKDVWYSGVEEFEKLNFKSKIVVGLVSDPKEWSVWFQQRFAIDDPEATSRLDEAELCLPWLIERKNVCWLQNKNEDSEEVGLKLIDICLGGQGQEGGEQLAQDMLGAITELRKIYQPQQG